MLLKSPSIGLLRAPRSLRPPLAAACALAQVVFPCASRSPSSKNRLSAFLGLHLQYVMLLHRVDEWPPKSGCFKFYMYIRPLISYHAETRIIG